VSRWKAPQRLTEWPGINGVNMMHNDICSANIILTENISNIAFIVIHSQESTHPHIRSVFAHIMGLYQLHYRLVSPLSDRSCKVLCRSQLQLAVNQLSL